MEDDVQKLLDFSFDFAKDILLDTNDIYPFASVLNKKGEVRHVGFQGDEDHEPKARDVIEVIHQYCEEQFNEGLIQAYALTYEVMVELDTEIEPSDAFVVDIMHTDDDALPLYYFPFKFIADVKLEFGECFAVKREENNQFENFD